MKVLFVGHFGAKNLGDELLLLAEIQMFSRIAKSPIKAFVYSYNTNTDYYKNYDYEVEQVIGLNFKRLFGSIASTIKAVKKSDFVVVGGGGIIQDKYFVYRPISTLLPALIAFIYNKPVYGFSLGVYKLNLKLNRKLVRFFVKNSDYITYRDISSGQNINKLTYSLKLKNVRQIPDSALGISYTVSSENAKSSYILIAIREVFASKIDELIKIIYQSIEETGVKEIKLVTFENTIEDKEVLDLLSSKISANIKVSIVEFPSVERYLDLISGAVKIIAGRLHACIPAYILDKDVLGLAYEEKVSDFCRTHGIQYSLIDDLLNIKEPEREVFSKENEVDELIDFIEYILNDHLKFRSNSFFMRLFSFILIVQSIVIGFFIHGFNINYKKRE